MEDTKGSDTDKDVIQADEKCNYLETLLVDCNSELEENVASEKATEPRKADAQPTAEFTTKQVISFSIAQNGAKDILSLCTK